MIGGTMIDYEKLKLAHELINKYCAGADRYASMEIVHGPNWVVRYETNIGGKETFFSLDDLVAKLIEFTTPKCKCGNLLPNDAIACDECINRARESGRKYKLGDKIWSYQDSIILNLVIHEIQEVNDAYLYCSRSMGGWNIDEKDAYPTKESVIYAQIEYWAKMLVNAENSTND